MTVELEPKSSDKESFSMGVANQTFFGITCGNCQHNADIDEFSSAPIFGELPKFEYQCPACMAAIKQLSGQIISIESRL